MIDRICPYCGRFFGTHGLSNHQRACEDKKSKSVRVPNVFNYVSCPMKRYDNAKKLVKKGIFMIDGIGDIKSILVDIRKDCIVCDHFSLYLQYEGGGYILEHSLSIPCLYGIHKRSSSYSSVYNLDRCNIEGVTVVEYVQKKFPEIEVTNIIVDDFDELIIQRGLKDEVDDLNKKMGG